jgi:hypothetical protein
MPYGEKYDLKNINERRKQRLTERDENVARLNSIQETSERNANIYGFFVTGALFITALVLYWMVSPLAGLFVLIISAVVHLSAIGIWIRNSVIVAQINSIQGELFAMEVLDDLQELLAKQNARTGEEHV